LQNIKQFSLFTMLRRQNQKAIKYKNQILHQRAENNFNIILRTIKDIFFARKLQQHVFLIDSEFHIYTCINLSISISVASPQKNYKTNCRYLSSRFTISMLFHLTLHRYTNIYLSHLLCCFSNKACTQLFVECLQVHVNQLCSL